MSDQKDQLTVVIIKSCSMDNTIEDFIFIILSFRKNS